jgi:hypothetical protein
MITCQPLDERFGHRGGFRRWHERRIKREVAHRERPRRGMGGKEYPCTRGYVFFFTVYVWRAAGPDFSKRIVASIFTRLHLLMTCIGVC